MLNKKMRCLLAVAEKWFAVQVIDSRKNGDRSTILKKALTPAQNKK